MPRQHARSSLEAHLTSTAPATPDPVTADGGRGSVIPAMPEPIFTPGAVAGLIGLLLVSGLARVPGMDHGPCGSDSLNYCVAALKTGVAHPPGYSGYVWLGWLLNLPFGHINRTFIGLSFCTGLASIVLTFVLARLMGLSVRTALAAALVLAFNVNLLVFSDQALNYAPECAITLAFACIAATAVRRRSFGWSLGATAVFAAAGAIRPTTTAYLFPLWLYVLWRTRATSGKPLERRSAARSFGELLTHVAVAVVLIGGWQTANTRLLSAAGFKGTTYDFQVMIPAKYDYASLGGQNTGNTAATASFHMPGFELLAWMSDHLNLHLLPHKPGWPEPSLGRAIKLSVIQAGKLFYYLAFGMPLLLLMPFTFLRRDPAAKSTAFDSWRVFLLFWVLPVGLFFVFGHLGSLGYTLFFTPALTIWTVRRLLEPGRRTGPPTLAIACVIVPLITLAFFDLARPFHAQIGWRRGADILALQNTAAAERQGFYAARSAPPGDPPANERAMTAAPNDVAFRAAADAAGWNPIPALPTAGGD